LTRKDLERIFSNVEKRPRITAFNEFGGRTPSDKPPIQTPAERARERGEPRPPHVEPVREPAPVGSYPGGSNGLPQPGPGPNGGPVPPPGPHGGYPGGPGQPPFPATAYPPGYGQQPPVPQQQGWGQQGPNQPSGSPPQNNYGAPPDWRPATTPHGQAWPPAGHRPQSPPQWTPPPATGNGNGDGSPSTPPAERPRENGARENGPGENGSAPDEDGSR
jgi:cell division protease FtsH